MQDAPMEDDLHGKGSPWRATPWETFLAPNSSTAFPSTLPAPHHYRRLNSTLPMFKLNQPMGNSSMVNDPHVKHPPWETPPWEPTTLLARRPYV
jgi:hypothetical protein